MDRFWAHVDKSGPNGCWLWTGRTTFNGWMRYGKFSVWCDGKTKHWRAHRYSWTIANGGIPEGLCVCHHCDVPLCVNPEHLFLGTNKDNTADMISKDRRWKGGFGEGHPMAKLTESDVLAVRQTKGTRKQVAAKFGVSPMTITHVCRGDTWSHVATGIVANGLKGSSKLTPQQVSEIRASKETQIEAARRFGVSQSTISNVRRNLVYKDTP